MCNMPFLPIPWVCFQCGTDQNPCHCKVIGPTLGFASAILLAIVCWPASMFCGCCMSEQGKKNKLRHLTVFYVLLHIAFLTLAHLPMDTSQYAKFPGFAAAVEAYSRNNLDDFVLRWPLLTSSITEFAEFAGAVVLHGIKANKNFNLRLGGSQLEIRRLNQKLANTFVWDFQVHAPKINTTREAPMVVQNNEDLLNLRSTMMGVGMGNDSGFERRNSRSRNNSLEVTSWNTSISGPPSRQYAHHQKLAQAGNENTPGPPSKSHLGSQPPNNFLYQDGSPKDLVTATNVTTTSASVSDMASTYPNGGLQVYDAEFEAHLHVVNNYITTCAAYLDAGGDPGQFHALRPDANPASLPQNVTNWAEGRAWQWYITKFQLSRNNHGHPQPGARPAQFEAMSTPASNYGGDQQERRVRQQPRRYPRFRRSPLPPKLRLEYTPHIHSHQHDQTMQYRSQGQQQKQAEDSLSLPSSQVQFEDDQLPGEYPHLFHTSAILPLNLLIRESTPPIAGDPSQWEDASEGSSEVLEDQNESEQSEGGRLEESEGLMSANELEDELDGWY